MKKQIKKFRPCIRWEEGTEIFESMESLQTFMKNNLDPSTKFDDETGNYYKISFIEMTDKQMAKLPEGE